MANKADILVVACSSTPNQDEEADKAFYKQLEDILWSLALVIDYK